MTGSGDDSGWVRFPLDLPITLWRDDVEATTGVARELALRRNEHGLTGLRLTLASGSADGVVVLAFRESLLGSLSSNAATLRPQLRRRGELTDVDNWSAVSRPIGR